MTERFYKLPVSIVANGRLTPADKIIWAALADRIGENGCCWPGIRTLAEDTRLATRTVLRSIQRLEVEGLLRIDRRGRGRANHYRVLTAKSVDEKSPPTRSHQCQNVTSGDDKMSSQAPTKCHTNQRDQLNQTERGGTHTRFIPPSALEVEQYARSIDFEIDGEKFVSHYAANGWMRGRSRIRDWRAVVRYWKVTEKTRNGERNETVGQSAKPIAGFIR